MSFNNKELIENFKSSMLAASAEIGKLPHEISRDAYIRATVDNDIQPRCSKRHLEELGGFTSAKALFFPNQDNIKAKTASQMIRRHKSKLDKQLATQQFLHEEIAELVKNVLTNNKTKLYKPVKDFQPKKRSKAKTSGKFKRSLVAHLSDTHFGANISKGEVGGVNSFNWEVASRRLAYFILQTCNYKKHYRKETEIVLLLNGDIIAGIIHNQEWFVDLATKQFGGTVHLLSQAISYLAQEFGQVRVYATPGNHGRFKHKEDKGRATTHKWDSFEMMCFVSLREIFKTYSNVDINISEAPYMIFDVQGHKVMITHGDTVFNPGNPGKSINMDNLRNQVNSLNASLKGNEKIDAVFLGHVHTPTVQMLDNECYVIINGCLSGLDPFANSIGIFKSHATQQIIEVTPDYSIGDMRFVQCDMADDDKSLDKIIEPFKELFE